MSSQWQVDKNRRFAPASLARLAISRAKRPVFRDYINITGRLGLGPGNWAWDQAVRRVGGQLGGIERVPSRFSLFLPSDLRIGPGSDATVSVKGRFGILDQRAELDHLVQVVTQGPEQQGKPVVEVVEDLDFGV